MKVEHDNMSVTAVAAAALCMAKLQSQSWAVAVPPSSWDRTM